MKQNKKVFTEKKPVPFLSNYLSVLILYFKYSQILNKTVLHYIFNCFFVSQRDKYEIVTETHPFKKT